ncbi:BRO-N domain-containing protein [Pectobacterium sp. LFLA-215]|uniref:BRO-N domain-containing protein n=1 Tax=Pectobacterium sp. LFLA-215 TaxID=3419008 RepID=UPI003F5C2E42
MKSHTLLVPFAFESHNIRAINHNGEPWFIAQDVCFVLGIQNVTQAIERLDEDERSMFNIGRQGEVNIVNESGMYTLVLRCRDAVKKGSVPHRFRKWVTSEVLPQIRKTGAYQQHSPSVNTPVVKQDDEYRYLVQVFIYDTIFASCVEMKGKGNTFKSIASGIATDLGYRPTGFVEGKVSQNKLVRM